MAPLAFRRLSGEGISRFIKFAYRDMKPLGRKVGKSVANRFHHLNAANFNFLLTISLNRNENPVYMRRG